jgi:hypothetical protein
MSDVAGRKTLPGIGVTYSPVEVNTIRAVATPGA